MSSDGNPSDGCCKIINDRSLIYMPPSRALRAEHIRRESSLYPNANPDADVVKLTGRKPSSPARTSRHYSSTGLLCLAYSLYSSEVVQSSLPCSTCFRVALSIGLGNPMDSRNATAAELSVYLDQKTELGGKTEGGGVMCKSGILV